MIYVINTGVPVPLERSRTKISGSPVRVTPSPYYRRLIREGDLKVVEAPKRAPKAAEKGKATTSKETA